MLCACCKMDLSSFDVVITSYGVAASEHAAWARPGGGGGTAGIFGRQWRRVVLDEAHTIKNSATGGARAVAALAAERRWVVTGTPLQNGLGDLLALLRFLRHEPWCEPLWWREAVARPHARGAPAERRLAMARLRAVLAPLMIRRTKVRAAGRKRTRCDLLGEEVGVATAKERGKWVLG